MILAIASGKGGTGKTSVATNLAAVTAENNRVSLLDCDTEQPNAHLFFDMEAASAEEVSMPIPKLIPEKCDGCGICGDACQFSAIVNIGKLVITNPGLCHGCSACWELCPRDALRPVERTIGRIREKRIGKLRIVVGELTVGEISGNRIIASAKDKIDPDELTIIDSAPGTSCPVVEALTGTDYVLLVAEPTPFGIANFRSVAKLAMNLDLPVGVVINRSDLGDGSGIHEFAREEGLEILGEIPNDLRVARAYSEGRLYSKEIEEYRDFYSRLAGKFVGVGS